MPKEPNWLTGLITARATVMTPLLILHGIILFFGTVIFFRSVAGGIAMFIIWLPILGYTLWRHEKWAKKAPWLLAPEKVAIRGIDVYGTDKKRISEKDIIDLEPVNNPEQKQLKRSYGKHEVTKK